MPSTRAAARAPRPAPARGHGHPPGGVSPGLSGQSAHRALRLALAAALVPFLALTGVGLVLLWPDSRTASHTAQPGIATSLVDAVVQAVERTPCSGELSGHQSGRPSTGDGSAGTAAPPATDCQMLLVRLSEGPDRGREVRVSGVARVSDDLLEPGTGVVLGFDPRSEGGGRYYLSDVQRGAPLLLLAALFGAAVIALGGRRGLAALGSLLLSFTVLKVFVLPALLAGEAPLPVAVVGAAVIMFGVLYLTYGVSVRTSVAVLGTLVSLGLIGLLAAVFTGLSRFSGLESEEAVLLTANVGQVDLRGLLLAGIVIGALGVLDDVTVTQVSAVWELRAANPLLPVGELVRSGLRIGRDHVVSTVNTLILAYAGASLPLLLLLAVAERSLLHTVTSEVIAQEIVRSLVGSIGLVAAVPVTTWLAAVTVARIGGRSPEVAATAGTGTAAAHRRRRW